MKTKTKNESKAMLRKLSDIRIRDIKTTEELEAAQEWIRNDSDCVIGGAKAFYSGHTTALTKAATKKSDSLEAIAAEWDDIAILRAISTKFGRQYKSEIATAWESGNYLTFSGCDVDDSCGGSESLVCELQRIRNVRGPSWLRRVSLTSAEGYGDMYTITKASK